MGDFQRTDRRGTSGQDTGTLVDTLAFLVGAWQVDRVVRDGGWTGRFQGTATVDPGTLVYHETGILSFCGCQVAASRLYRYHPRADGALEVTFEDGRFFHLLDLRRGWWDAVHQCGQDRYDGTFRVGGPDLLENGWSVAGPGKDQELSTCYRRLPLGPVPPMGARCAHARL